jgi:nucleoside-triphosphatase
MNTKKNLLLTGQPGIGKTTLIRKLANNLKDVPLSGFYTTEIRDAGIRKGFALRSFNKNIRMLAHVDIKSPYRVSKYRVDVEGFEKFLDVLSLRDRTQSIIIIDEIGKMECFSNTFRSLVMDILNSDVPVIATIALKGSGMIADIKKRDDIELLKVTLENRDVLISEIIGKMGSGLNI